MTTTDRVFVSADLGSVGVVQRLLQDGYGGRAPTASTVRRWLLRGERAVVLGGERRGKGVEAVAVVVLRREGEGVEVLWMATRGDRRRRGWARAIVEKLDGETMTVLLREDNGVAITAARATGFAATGLLRGEFGDLDGIRMERRGQ